LEERMDTPNHLRLLGAVGLVLGLLFCSCSKKAAETEGDQLSAEQKVAEAQKNLEEAKKELAETKKQARRAAQSQTKASTPAVVKTREVTVPSGTPIAVRTIESLSTKTQKTGDRFEAVLDQPLEVGGVVVAERGAAVKGVVSNSDPGGRTKGVASIALNLTAIRAASGEELAVTTQSVSQKAPTSKKKDAAKIGIGSGLGAAIGAIAGGGKGAAIGAGAGAAGGTGVVLSTRGDPAVVPSESLLKFRLTAPITYTEKR
jgi:hypothetical protein